MIDILVGGLYGDEGKGKIVGFLTKKRKYDYVMRVNASTNASHCVKVGNEVHITKQLPSVFFSEYMKLVVAPGALLNLSALVEELKGRPDLKQLKGKVFIAENISMIIQSYIDANKTNNHFKAVGSTNQGTTQGTIARAARHSLKLYDVANCVNGLITKSELVHLVTLTSSQFPNVEVKGDTVKTKFPSVTFDAVQITEDLIADYNTLIALLGKDCVVDYTSFLFRNEVAKKEVLIEGCNGTLLDNVHGVHPYTTSISTISAALLAGANLSPLLVRDIFITATAYTCCLNKRPMVTEMTKEDAERIYVRNPEIDPAESMLRRVGWLDLPALRKAVVGHTGCKLIINKADVLGSFEEIKICIAYELSDGTYTAVLPDNTTKIENAKPMYLTIRGWGDITTVKDATDLPKTLIAYLDFISGSTGCEVIGVGNGQGSDDVIEMTDGLLTGWQY